MPRVKVRDSESAMPTAACRGLTWNTKGRPMSCAAPTWFAIAPPAVHLNVGTYFSVYFPPQLAYYLTAVLVTLPGTYFIRLALLPFTLYVTYRASTKLDLASGNVAFEEANLGLLTLMAMIFFRVVGWTFHYRHYVRVGKGRDASKPRSLSEILLDACDLCCNFRGIGWDFSNGRIFINSQAAEVTNTPNPSSKKREFVREAIISYFLNSFVFEACLAYLLRYPLPSAPSSPSILSSSLYAVRRICHALLYPTFTYTNLGGSYAVYSLIGVLILGQDVDDWPPFYDRPWKSTSLTEFWGKRWHQAFRDAFGQTGGRPFGILFGRVGLVLGTFFVSGLFHDLGYWGMHRARGVCCNTTSYFVLNGVGICLEAVFKAVTGKRVSGTLGWIWTAAYLIGCALVTMSPFCMQDLMRSYSAAALTQPIYIGSLVVKSLIPF
ncbi:membrane bound O-acyl transferase family-domain-containing protein [Mucidula mucida]|nr:membrane bound O-acyl transferase family-domain-containing protein [Mucidula mucida]